MILINGRSIESESFGVRRQYVEFFSHFDDVVISSALSAETFAAIEPAVTMLVLPGGPDVDVARYGDAPSPFTQRPDPFLEYSDRVILPVAIDLGVPIFGICRGLQTLNVHFGGTLEQDNSLYHPKSDTRRDMAHKIKMGGMPDFEVNSLHHQSILDLGAGFEPLGWCVEDGTVEVIKHELYPIYAVQWHPEFLTRLSWMHSVISSMIDTRMGR